MQQQPQQELRPETLENGDIPEELLSLMRQVLQRYGADSFGERLETCKQLLSRCVQLNEELAVLPVEDDADALIADMMEANRAYYQYLMQLPEDVKRLLLLFHGWGPSDVQELCRPELPETLFRQLTETLPMVQAIRPRRYIMAVDPVSNRLPQLQDNNLIYVGKHGKQPVKTAVSIECPEHMKIDGNINLSTYDRSIINGVSSILESGNSSFTIPMLYHAMTGKANPTVDDQLLGEIQSKLDKMRRLMISIDLTEEYKAHFIGEDGGESLLGELSIEGYLLPLNKLTGVVNGKRSEMYQIIEAPPLYSYAKAKNQIASVPINLLNAPLNNNATTIPLKTYLLFRIEGMKNKKNKLRSDKILYASIYEELDDANAGKTRKMRIRNYTKVILDHFVREGYIKAYSELRTGRTISGVKIVLP